MLLSSPFNASPIFRPIIRAAHGIRALRTVAGRIVIQEAVVAEELRRAFHTKPPLSKTCRQAHDVWDPFPNRFR